MEINIDIIIDLYKKRMMEAEQGLIISQAQVIAMEERINKLERLLKENNIEIVD